HAAQPQPPAQMTPEERRRSRQCLRCLSPCGVVAHRRVEHPCHLQIGRHLDARQRDEADARIVDRAPREQLAQLVANLFTYTIGSMALCHYIRNSISVRVTSPGSTRSISSTAAARDCSTCSVVVEIATMPSVARCHTS